jgi:hypothetical protein
MVETSFERRPRIDERTRKREAFRRVGGLTRRV